MTTAIKVIAAILGVIAALWVLPHFDAYVWFLVAVAGAIAVGVVVYHLIVRLVSGLLS